ncbi:DUF1697 domain-containing protein [Phaeacidiphilus oryzae]|uniref:DUF1697 domain-containing protein n=1 Tax=Phaeacidiphilus oryzae TaxID=348818 RepID=UPI00056B46D2|nr:DUF1697 domain-containing protein [Phaeacidiphilus oryzae]
MAERYAALLRGINVGGHARVPMAELRKLMEGLGHTAVQTHLNSGNAAFTAPAGRSAALQAELEEAIAAHFGFRVACLVRDGGYLRAVAEANPYPEEAAADGKKVHAVFLSEQPSGGAEALAAAVPPGPFAPEGYALGDRVLYLDLPNGIGRSKLPEALGRSAPLKPCTTTARNWNTVLRLVELTAE